MKYHYTYTSSVCFRNSLRLPPRPFNLFDQFGQPVANPHEDSSRMPRNLGLPAILAIPVRIEFGLRATLEILYTDALELASLVAFGTPMVGRHLENVSQNLYIPAAPRIPRGSPVDFLQLLVELHLTNAVVSFYFSHHHLLHGRGNPRPCVAADSLYFLLLFLRRSFTNSTRSDDVSSHLHEQVPAPILTVDVVGHLNSLIELDGVFLASHYIINFHCFVSSIHEIFGAARIPR